MPTINGTSNNDTLAAPSNLDYTIQGLLGNDYITGLGGDDLLYGYQSTGVGSSDGSDTIFGGAGNDSIYGQYGDDLLYGGADDDYINAGSGGGSDTMYGELGNDTLYNLSNEVAMYGGDGNDSLTSSGFSGEQNTLDGGAGSDTISTGSITSNLVYGGDGNDRISVSAISDTVYAGDGADTIFSQGNHLIYGGNDDDFIFGNQRDSIDAGDGNDTVYGRSSSTPVLAYITTIQGGAGNDLLYSYNSRELMYGGNGDDLLDSTIFANENDNADTMDGGAGDNTLRGGYGDDVYLFDETGTAEIVEESGNDKLVFLNSSLSDIDSTTDGDNLILFSTNSPLNIVTIVDYFLSDGTKVETIEDQFGNTTTVAALLSGATSGDDTIEGSANPDFIDGLAGADSINGNSGADTLMGNDGNDTILGGGDGDTLSGDSGNDYLYGLDGADSINGGSDNDEIYGNAGTDEILGGTGNDTIDGGTEADTLDGGDGSDIVSYYYSASAVQLDLGGSTQSGGEAEGDIIANFELFSLSLNNDSFVGDSAGNIIFAHDGADTLQGGGGADQFYGGNGADSMLGGSGNDTAYGDAGADSFDGGDDSDWLTYYYSSSAVGVDLINAANGSGDGLGDVVSNIEHLQGSNYDDTIQGDGSNMVFYGAAGSDSINAGAGADAFYGDAGADTLDGGADGDWMYFTDSAAVTINLTSGVHSGADAVGDVYLNIEFFSLSQNGDHFTGDSQVANIYGLGGDDTIDGGSANTYIVAGDGADSIHAGDGDDTLASGSGADTMNGGNGIDAVSYSTSGAIIIDLATNSNSGGDAAGDVLTNIEVVSGSAFADVITGASVAEGLFGGSGADTLTGAGGNDNLFGDGGADIFYYSALSDSTNSVYDTISDFSQGDGDKIDFSSLGSSFTFNGTGGYTGTAEEVIYSQGGGYTYVGLDSDGDSYTDLFLSLVGTINLTASDFIFS